MYSPINSMYIYTEQVYLSSKLSEGSVVLELNSEAIRSHPISAEQSWITSRITCVDPIVLYRYLLLIL